MQKSLGSASKCFENSNPEMILEYQPYRKGYELFYKVFTDTVNLVLKECIPESDFESKYSRLQEKGCKYTSYDSRGNVTQQQQT